jgi:acyl-coenzyme A synthetase/AMP-(fatty) acid ligase
MTGKLAIENALLADEAVQLCEAVGLAVGEVHVPVAHLVLKQDCEDEPEDVIRRVHKRCVKTLTPDAVPRGYKIRRSFNVLPSGKRDTLSLKGERDGFVVPCGNDIKKVVFVE